MSNLNTHGVTDYASAAAFLKGRYSKTLCYATTLTDEGACITVRQHGNAIIRYYKTGVIEIRNAGWLSSTTTNRLHKMTPNSVRVSLAKGGRITSPAWDGSQTADWVTVIEA